MTLTPQEQDIVRRVLAGESQAAAGRVHDVSQRDVSRIMEAAGYERQCRWVKEGEQAECAAEPSVTVRIQPTWIGAVRTIRNGPLIGNQVYLQSVDFDKSVAVVLHPTAGQILFNLKDLALPSVTRTPEPSNA